MKNNIRELDQRKLYNQLLQKYDDNEDYTEELDEYFRRYSERTLSTSYNTKEKLLQYILDDRKEFFLTLLSASPNCNYLYRKMGGYIGDIDIDKILQMGNK